MSNKPKSSHTGAIVVTTVVLLPVLYVGLIFGFLSYDTRHEPSPTLGPAYEALVAPIPYRLWKKLFGIWRSLDPNGASLLDQEYDPPIRWAPST